MADNAAFWSVSKIDLEKYKIGAAVYNNNRAQGGLCNCQDCQNLIALRDQILAARNGPTFFGIMRNADADIEKVKMSLVVKEPGFFKSKILSMQTDGRFDTVYFPQAGKHSFVSLYKAARNAPEGMMFLDEEIKASFQGDIPANYNKTFGNVFVMGMLAGEHWNDIKNQIQAVIAGEEVEEEAEVKEDVPNFADVFMIDDRYIPIFSYNRGEYIITAEDGTHERLSSIPGLPSDNEAASLQYLMGRIERLYSAYRKGHNYSLSAFAYDIQTHSLVAGVEILDFVWNTINNNKGKFDKSTVEVVSQKLSPGQMMKAIRMDFLKNGADDFTITEIYPCHVSASWSVYNMGGNESDRVEHYGYAAGVSFKGKPLIGNNGSKGGRVYIRFSEEDNRPRLIKSSWCQRVSSWSKNNLGVVDQKYDIWALADWLSGPFAEEHRLKSDKAPLLFAGNKATNAKKNALDKLRARLNKLG